MWVKEEEEEVEEGEVELAIEKMEAQAWICLYNLLSTREVISNDPDPDWIKFLLPACRAAGNVP